AVSLGNVEPFDDAGDLDDSRAGLVDEINERVRSGLEGADRPLGAHFVRRHDDEGFLSPAPYAGAPRISCYEDNTTWRMKKNQMHARDSDASSLCTSGKANHFVAGESVGDERGQYGPDVLVDHQVGHIVELCCIAVEDDQLGTVPLGHHRETGGR